MPTLDPKQFIQVVFIHDLGGMIDQKFFYNSFFIMGVGIEYLGKCIDTKTVWNKEGGSRVSFENAVKNLKSLKKYEPFLSGKGKFDLYRSLRCGMAHSSAPSYEITFSSQNETAHLVEANGRLNLKCEDFFADFKAACEEIIAMEFKDKNNKMNKGFLEVPGETK
jgi:hypothetical protein